MAIPSQQIGWSQRAKLLWNISKQLENLIKVAGNVQLPTTSTTTTVAPTTTTTTTLFPIDYKVRQDCVNGVSNIVLYDFVGGPNCFDFINPATTIYATQQDALNGTFTNTTSSCFDTYTYGNVGTSGTYWTAIRQASNPNNKLAISITLGSCSTTTTTTAAPMSYSYSLYAQSSFESFCGNESNATLYASVSSLNVGVALYFDSELTSPANFPSNPVYIGLGTVGNTIWILNNAVISGNAGTCS